MILCVHEGWGYHDRQWRRGLDFHFWFFRRPSGSSRQLPAWAEQSRPACSAPMPHGIYGEVTTAAGDALSPNTLKQSAQMISHAHTHRHTHTHRWEDKMYGSIRTEWKKKMRENLQKINQTWDFLLKVSKRLHTKKNNNNTNTVWTELHLNQQDKRKKGRGRKGGGGGGEGGLLVTERRRMDFPLCVAMATAVDGGWLISCTAVELGGEREGEGGREREKKREREGERGRERRYLWWRKEEVELTEESIHVFSLMVSLSLSLSLSVVIISLCLFVPRVALHLDYYFIFFIFNSLFKDF